MSYIGADDLRRDNLGALLKKKEIQVKADESSFTDESWDILAKVIGTTTSLEKLAFSGDNAVAALQNDKVVDALAKNRTIKTLDLWHAYGGDEGAKAVSAILKKNSTIEAVDLGHNDIGVEGAKAIADTLKYNKELRFIDFDNNHIGDEGVKAIADALKVNPFLQELGILSNNIGERGGGQSEVGCRLRLPLPARSGKLVVTDIERLLGDTVVANL